MPPLLAHWPKRAVQGVGAKEPSGCWRGRPSIWQLSAGPGVEMKLRRHSCPPLRSNRPGRLRTQGLPAQLRAGNKAGGTGGPQPASAAESPVQVHRGRGPGQGDPAPQAQDQCRPGLGSGRRAHTPQQGLAPCGPTRQRPAAQAPDLAAAQFHQAGRAGADLARILARPGAGAPPPRQGPAQVDGHRAGRPSRSAGLHWRPGPPAPGSPGFHDPGAGSAGISTTHPQQQDASTAIIANIFNKLFYAPGLGLLRRPGGDPLGGGEHPGEAGRLGDQDGPCSSSALTWPALLAKSRVRWRPLKNSTFRPR